MTRASRPTLLILDDDASLLPILERFARGLGFDVRVFEDPRAALAAMPTLHPDAALTDLQMPELSGIDVLREIRAADADCPVILMTGNATIDTAIEAVKAGALDYLSKPIDFPRLEALLNGILESKARRERVLSSEADLAVQTGFHGMIGRSAAMQQLFDMIRRLAPHARTVLVTGETGTGKELVARAIHDQGPRRSKRFLTVNCSAVVETLFESELFGHVRGAFTGATDTKVGVLEHASGGTIFLDEIGELPLSLQPKLLRAIEYGEIQRVGSLETRKVDVRIVAATNRDLQNQPDRFRPDLYFRLAVVELHLPPLRKRRGDIPYLTAAFVRELSKRMGRQITGVSPEAEQLLMDFEWPGNIRQLRNTIERACMLSERSVLTERDLQGAMTSGGIAAAETVVPPRAAAPAPVTLKAAQREQVERALEETGGNKVAAARRLGVSRRSLYRYIERYGLKQ